MFCWEGTLTEPRYTIRLRHAGAGLVVEDAAGDAYIVSEQGLQCRLTGRRTLDDLTPTLRRLGWVPVPAVAPYTRAKLRCLLSPLAA